MGNSALAGHALNMCGCTDTNFEYTAQLLINFNEIEPWNARSLIKENLQRQGDLARKSVLRNIPVSEGLSFIKQKVRGQFMKTISKEQFANICAELVKNKTNWQMQNTDRGQEELFSIFDAMDFDRSGTLSLGEWAGGSSVFFKGDQAECVKAVFKALDTDDNGQLSKYELQEYLKPFVKAMTPPTADCLRPILLKKVTDDIYFEMDLDHKNDISSDEMLNWTRRGNSIIERMADIIEREVYRICLAEREKKLRNGDGTGGWSSAQSSDKGFEMQPNGVPPGGWQQQQQQQQPVGPGAWGPGGGQQAPPGWNGAPGQQQQPLGMPPYGGQQPSPFPMGQQQGPGNWGPPPQQQHPGNWGPPQQQYPVAGVDRPASQQTPPGSMPSSPFGGTSSMGWGPPQGTLPTTSGSSAPHSQSQGGYSAEYPPRGNGYSHETLRSPHDHHDVFQRTDSHLVVQAPPPPPRRGGGYNASQSQPPASNYRPYP